MAAQKSLRDQAFRIMPCYGSFDHISVESNSVDFIIQIEALHHADELGPPIIEGFRVLKSGGFFVSIDRSWPDAVNRNVLDELLDHRYSKEWLVEKGFPSDKPFSRRDNGEHEYHDLDWENAFKSAGFVSEKIVHLHPKFKLWHFKKRIVGLLKLNGIARIKVPSRSGIFRGYVMQKTNLNLLKAGAVLGSLHPRPLTVSVWQKP
jgi:SAM-dependent methyltransferase